jgi:hypothetical protein
MFTIIGSDGKEYGPVSADTVKQWMAAGRANAQTKIRREGDVEWKTVGEIPELAGAPGTPPAPAAGLRGEPKDIAADLIARAPGGLDIGSCFSRSWALFKANLWPLVATNLVVSIVAVVVAGIPVVGIVANLLLTGVFYGGLYYFFLGKVRGLPVEFGDAFAGFSKAFVPLMLASLVSTLLTCLGLILLLLPGIYLAVSWQFTYALVIDKQMAFWPAMEVSRRVITARWWSMFGLLLLGGIICLLGVLLLIVGVVFAMPVAIGALLFAYEDLCNPPPAAA